MFPDGSGQADRRRRFRDQCGAIHRHRACEGAFSQHSPRCVKVKRGLRLNMANNPKKVKDPTEVALSAIQEALNISDVPASDNNRSSVRSDVTPPNSSSSSGYNDGGFDTRPSADRPMFEPIEEPRSSRRAANDDRETIGQI